MSKKLLNIFAFIATLFSQQTLAEPKMLEIEKLATHGNLAAQTALGVMYLQGKEIDQNYVKAFQWLIKSAQQGDATAQFSLGIMYEQGLGVTQDYIQALEWYQKSTKQDDANAQFNIGGMYATSRGVNINYSKTREYYLKSAELGNAMAQFNIGKCYFQGIFGFNKDEKIALEWVKKAAKNGYPQAKFALELYEDN